MALPADLEAIVRRLNRDNARAAARLTENQRDAYTAACQLAERMGAADPTLRRVVLFGSTLPGRRYRKDSDIDLAVEGGDRAFMERIVAEATRPVDIIGLDELRPGIRESVLTEGLVLYDAELK